jgi:STAS-like domain of unknown function (DUF4325)
MTKVFQLREEFGTSLSDGKKAHGFRVMDIEPFLTSGALIEIDFTGIRVANSGFVNALIAGLFEQHGAALLDKIVFRGCLPTVRVLVQAAVDLGLIKHQERLAQSC